MSETHEAWKRYQEIAASNPEFDRIYKLPGEARAELFRTFERDHPYFEYRGAREDAFALYELLGRLPPRYQWVRFDHPELPKRINPQIVVVVQQLVDKFSDDYTFETPCLGIIGPSGAGKTVSAILLGRSWIYLPGVHYHSCAFGDPDALEALKDEQFLIVDDLGAEPANHRAKTSKLLHYRYGEQLPTVVTSEYSREVLESRYDNAGVIRRALDSKIILGG